MPRQRLLSVFALGLMLGPVVGAQAEPVLGLLPKDALGYAVVRSLGRTNDRVNSAVQIFAEVLDVVPPAPLTLLKAATGLGPGLDESGDALLVLLPGNDGTAPRPMLLAPVTDYAALASSLGVDPSGAISRVTIAGEEVLMAKRSDYALVMNLEHRPTMEALVGEGSSQAPAAAGPLDEWALARDVAVVVLKPGLSALVAEGRRELDAELQSAGEQTNEPEMAELFAQEEAGFNMIRKLLDAFGEEVAAVGVALSIDDQTNVRFAQSVAFEPGGSIAMLEPASPMDHSPLRGYGSGPFVVSGGGPMPAEWAARLVELNRKFVQANPKIYGFEDFGDEEWKQLDESWRASMGVRSFSMAMYAGEKDEPLFSNIYYIAQIPDSSEYLKSVRKSIELWNGLVEKSSNDVKMTYELTDVEVAGHPALLMIADAGAAAADENVPMVKPIMEAMFGEDAKLRSYAVAADETNLVMAVGSEAHAAKAVEAVLRGESGLAESAEVKATAALLNPQAAWSMYVSPPGCVAWFGRFISSAFGQFGGAALTIPEYTSGPPLGLSAHFADGQFRSEIVAPVQMLKDLAAYIKKCDP